jgi:glycosyltransferase involved in cell wall biosynthesis
MRVTLVAPLVAPLRAAQAGGAQVILTELARRLAERGEEVEVVAPPGSRVVGVAVRTVPGAPFPEAMVHGLDGATPQSPLDPTPSWPALQAAAYLDVAAHLRASRPAAVHAHALDWPSFYALAAAGLPTVHTLHLGPIDPAATAAARAASAGPAPRPTFVAVSRACAALWRGIVPIDAVIGNGADPDSIAYSGKPAPDLALVAGRVAPEKGTHLAVAAALQVGMRVVVAGDVYDRAYFDEQVAPLLGPRVEYLGPVPHRRLGRLYGRAAVALVASLWEEPFGMVAVEANLAGTPVAGFARGALPEVVGAAGGVLTEDTSVASLATAIREAAALDRGAARDDAATRHPIDRMVESYRALYRDVAHAR